VDHIFRSGETKRLEEIRRKSDQNFPLSDDERNSLTIDDGHLQETILDLHVAQRNRAQDEEDIRNYGHVRTGKNH